MLHNMAAACDGKKARRSPPEQPVGNITADSSPNKTAILTAKGTISDSRKREVDGKYMQ